MKVALAVLLLVHGLIHLLGFAKAFGIGSITQLRQPIPEFLGWLWLLATALFVGSGATIFIDLKGWWIVVVIAVIISQFLIFTSWADAKFGSIANILIATALTSVTLHLTAGAVR